MIGQISAVRAFKALKLLRLYLASKIARPWFAEELDSIKSQEINKIAGKLDLAAAKEQTARFRQEHTDAFCLHRDQRYANRSRRWLWTKAAQSKYDACYEAWAGFTRENLDVKSLKDLHTKDPDIMARKDAKELMTK